MPRTADPERKSAIYDAAERLFSTYGYHATSVREIAAEIDRQGASLYTHIGGKEDILWAVVSRAADEFLAALAPIAASALDPEEKLRRAIAAHVRVVASNPHAATVYLHEWQQLGAVRRDAIRARRDAYERLVRDILAEGMASGRFALHDVKMAGLLVLSTVNGVYQWYRPDGDLSPEQIAQHFSALILEGLRKTRENRETKERDPMSILGVLAEAEPKIDFEESQEGPEFEARLAAFETRIARGEKIEPSDWMPVDYRKQLIRMISQHAHSEIVGQLPEGGWIPNAPSMRRKMALTAKVQDEAGHGQLLYRAAETLGRSREDMIDDLLTGKAEYSNIFNYPAATWADVGMIGWLVDAAAIVNQLMLAEGSYGPYARAMKRICYEESFHLKQGQHFVVTLAGGTPRQRQEAQEALNRWWWPTLMMFGPSDKHSVHLAKMMRWRIKTKTNDELRYDFVAQYVPQILKVGLTIPDPELRYDEADGRWHFGEPDWEEFKRVISGHGPMNAERIAVRRAAHEEGRWVREALSAQVNAQG